MVAIGRSMPVVLDTYRFVTALKRTGKNANFTAEEFASAIDVSQQGSDVLTKSAFDVAMAGIDTRFARLEATLGTSDAKFETLRADIRPRSNRARCRTCCGCRVSCLRATA